MRLGFDGHVLTGKFQGTRTTLGNLLRALIAQPNGHEIIVFTNDVDEARANLGCEGGAFSQTQFVGLDSHSPLRRLLWEIPKKISLHKIDFGIFNYISPIFGKSILFIHDILPLTHGKYFPLLFRIRSKFFFLISIYRARLIVSVSEYTSSEMEARFGARLKGRLCTIPNGPSFPVETYFAPRMEKIPRYILCVGRIELRKNVKLLVDAFLAADLPDVELIVVGSFDHSYSYNFPDDTRVRHISVIDDSNLISLYRGASLFVYPSIAEGFGLPLLDAVLFGIPTLSSELTAMPEVAGGLAEYFDLTAADASEWLRQRIVAHFGGHSVQRPSEDARRKHAAKLSWHVAAQKFMQVLSKLKNADCEY